jgi:tetratricopeptide (TPR) repeat protein
MKRAHPRLYIFREAAMNSFGYEFLFRGNPKIALEIFQLNAEAYPKSANVYDSLSDAYDAIGNRDLSLELAQKALQMLPADDSIDDRRKDAIKQAAENRIKKLKSL